MSICTFFNNSRMKCTKLVNESSEFVQASICKQNNTVSILKPVQKRN